MGDIEEAAKRGDRLDLLIALRDNIARTLDETSSGRDTAALSKRLLEVVDEIEGYRHMNRDSPLRSAKDRTRP